MMKEMTVESIESTFDDLFKEIDQLTEDLMQGNSYSLSQAYAAYEESKEN